MSVVMNGSLLLRWVCQSSQASAAAGTTAAAAAGDSYLPSTPRVRVTHALKNALHFESDCAGAAVSCSTTQVTCMGGCMLMPNKVTGKRPSTWEILIQPNNGLPIEP